MKKRVMERLKNLLKNFNLNVLATRGYPDIMILNYFHSVVRMSEREREREREREGGGMKKQYSQLVVMA